MWSFGVRRNARMVVTLLALAALSAISYADQGEAPKSGAWLGVTGDRIDDGWRERENYWAKGILITDVAPGGPADRIGLSRGDILVSVGSKVLRTPEDLSLVEGQLEPGQPVSVVVARNGGRLIRIVNLDPARLPGTEEPEQARLEIREEVAPTEAEPEVKEIAPDSAKPEAEGAKSVEEGAKSAEETAKSAEEAPVAGAEEVPVPEVAPRGADPLGARVQTLNADLGAALGAPSGHGVLILEVQSGGAAGRAGIRAGDVITHVGEEAVDTSEDLLRALERSPNTASVQTIRQGTERKVKVSLVPEKPAPPKVAEPPAGAAEVKEGAAPDHLLIELRDELRRLQAEVQKLRAELDELKKM